MVAVGDQRLAVGQVGLDLRLLRGIGEGPETMAETVLGLRGQQRDPLHHAFDHGRRSARPAVPRVAEEQGFEVGGRGAHQIGAVLDDVGHDVLVREHDTLLRGGERECPDHTALQDAAGPLLVHVERGHRVRGEDTLCEPALESVGGLPVACGGRAGLREDQPHDVVRVR